MLESSPSHPRQPPYITTKGKSDEVADAAALTYLLTEPAFLGVLFGWSTEVLHCYASCQNNKSKIYKNRRTSKKTPLQGHRRKKLLSRLLLHYVDCLTLSQIPQLRPQRQRLSIPRMKKGLRESEEGKVRTSSEMKEEFFLHAKAPLVSCLAVKERISPPRAM